MAGLRHYDGDDRLDPCRVGHAEDGDLSHLWVSEDRLLDLSTGHVFPARLDHVLLAVDNIEIALVVEPPQIAAVEPAALERFRRLLRIVVVAKDEMGAAVDDLADLSDRQVRAIIVDDAGLDVQPRPPGRA